MSFGQRNLDREKPEIDFPEGDAPTELVITDLIEGAGAEVVAGSACSPTTLVWHSPPVKSLTRPGTAASRCRSRWALARLSVAGMRVCPA